MRTETHWWQKIDLRFSVKEKLALHFLTLTSVSIISLVIVSVFIARAHLRQKTISQLISEAAAKEDAIEARFQRDWELSSLWSKRPDVSSALYTNNPKHVLDSIAQDAREEGISITGIGLLSSKNILISEEGVIRGDYEKFKLGGIHPLITDKGWEGHSVFVPIYDNDRNIIGYFITEFHVRDFLGEISNVSAVGESAEVLLVKQNEKFIQVLLHKYTAKKGLVFNIAWTKENESEKNPMALALQKQEGATITKNYEGREVYAAYRYLPRIGWGIVLTVDVSEALIGAQALAVALFAVGLLLLGMAILLSAGFANRLSKPLLKISKNMEKLGPHYWEYKRSVFTGDEMESVDVTTADLVRRLSKIYKDLEQEVNERTKNLKEQYERNKAILNSIIHGVVLCDAEGNIISLNPAAENLLKIQESSIIGASVYNALELHRNTEKVGGEQHPIFLCIKDKKPISQSFKVAWSLLDMEKNEIAVDFSVTPILSGENVLGAVAVFRDVTEERRVDEMKSEFISLASHQLRTPLSVINWYRELLQETGGSDLQKQYLEEIAKAGQRMSDLVGTLLQTAKLESKGISAEMKEIDVCKFFRDLCKEFTLMAAQKSIKWIPNVPEKETIISTDPVLLHIVLQNLFSNALKYTAEKGTVELNLRKEKDKIILSVKDTGIGIPKNVHCRIFERLFRAENGKNMDATGSGLGLYISRMITEILGGDIFFKSQEGKGSTFEVVIPS